ncbi:calcium-binding protein 7 isoform X1 [Rousettus aegyptiacus]|uniref:calcium-binding protein 7 isoform X1 n=1 Tax=Rousettus aegyptiacus TaxID=9407 RepID=UPI0007895223|nr:calcium-binding protein 7 isoform X1 [Rousettus aegyptiacus]
MVDSWAICQFSLTKPAGSSGFSMPGLGCGISVPGGLGSGMLGLGVKSQPALLHLHPSEIREAFKVFDRDGNGFISKQELGTAMRSLGYMPNEVELEVIIQRLDMDGDGQVDFEEFVTLLGPKLSTSGIPERFHGTDFDTVFWKCDMQKLTVDELKRLLYDTFCEHLSMKDIENIIMTEEESHLGTAEECPVDVETCSNQQIRQTCVRKSLICAFAIAFIISVMLIAANQVLRSGMK